MEDASGPREVAKKKNWLRGQMCPFNVKTVDLAPEGTQPVNCLKLSEGVRQAMANRGAKVIHPDGERRFQESGIRP